MGLASQFAAPQVAEATAKIQQALDRSGIQFKVRPEQDKVCLLALGIDFGHTPKRRAGVARLGDFASIVVGSRFGGAVAAARLAQAGSRFWSAVDVGRGGSCPGDSTDLNAGWLWQAGGGLFDIRWLDRILSVQGVGWRGGSLIYANVFARPLWVYDLFGNVWECVERHVVLHELKGSAWTSAFSRGNPAAFNDANDFMQDGDTGFSCVSNDADTL